MLSPIDLLDIAESAATRAAHYLRSVERPPDPSAWTVKGQRDFVTHVDREAERLIAETLLAAAPDSRILGEELSPTGAMDGLVWVVDPLDGTTNFLHGVPVWAVSIGAARDGELLAGVVLDVPHRRLYRASQGGGAWEDGRRLGVSTHHRPGAVADRDRLSLQGNRTGSRSTSVSSPRWPRRRAASVARARPRSTWRTWRRGASMGSGN